MKVDEQGRVTIPKNYREYLNIKNGDFVHATIKKVENNQENNKRGF
jgi:AbrB family looped-hinge helix DNA binding protein